MSSWNPWHGCTKISPGCMHCYVYRIDARHDRDSSEVKRNATFDLPLKHRRDGEYKLQPSDGIVYTCFTSDFLHEAADEWRGETWDMIRTRSDLHFLFITKRIDRLEKCLPTDWGDGWENVSIGCTCENQNRADYRLPIFLSLPIHRRFIICEPLLEKIDLARYLDPAKICQLIAGGESGTSARICDFGWVMSLHDQCAAASVSFHFKQTGAHFVKNGKLYNLERRLQFSQARRAGIDIK